MAITSTQQTQLLQLLQAMFGTAPDTTYLAQLSASLSAGKTLAELAQILSGTPLFFGKDYAASLSPQQFADSFVNDLVGNHATLADKAWAVTYITDKMAAGASQAGIIAELIQALSSIPLDDPNWGNAARHYNTVIVRKIIDNLADHTVDTPDKANAESYLLWQMASGLSLGTIIDQLIILVDSIDYNDPTWGATAALFDNRTEVLKYYTVDTAGTALDPGTLQQALKAVTANTDSIAIAKALINESALSESTYGDYAASISTIGKVAVGGSAIGNIATVDDEDWFAVSMSAGTTYTIRQQGQGHEAGTLWNPSIAGIYSSTGALMPDSANDDSRIDGGLNGRDARVTFTPNTSGTYYIAAGVSSSASGTGTYTVSVAESSMPSVLPIISLAAPEKSALPEGNIGDTTSFTFIATRTGDLNIASSVNWIVDGHGDNPANESDFVANTPLSGTINFAAGQTTASITVKVQGDALVESNEDFAVILFNPSNAVVGFSSPVNKLSHSKSGGFTGKDAAGRFIGDETIYTIPAGNGGGIFTFNYDMHSIADRADIYVNGELAITTGTSVSESGTLTLPSNILKANDRVKVVITGTNTETAWNYTVNYVEGTPASNNIAIATILDDDAPLPTLSIAASNFPAAEGNSRPTPYIYTVTRVGNLNAESSVNWTVTGSGENPANAADFVGRVLPSGTVTFAAGVSTQEIKVEVQGDTLFEPDEGFVVTLSNPSGAKFEPADAIVESIIINDDLESPLTTIFIDPNPDPSSISKKEGNTGETTTYTFNVVRSGNLSEVSTVDWVVTGSGANPANKDDFKDGVLPSGTLTFLKGKSIPEEIDIKVNVRGDTTYEQNETFVVALSNPTNALLSTPIANTVPTFKASGGGIGIGTGTVNPDGSTVITKEYVLTNGDGELTLNYDMKVIPDQAVIFVNGVQTEFTGRTAPSTVIGTGRLTTSNLTLNEGDKITVVITGENTDPIWDYTLRSPDSSLRLDNATDASATQTANGTSTTNNVKNLAGVATNTYTVTQAGNGTFTLEYDMGAAPNQPDKAEIFINGVRNVFTSVTNSFVPIPVTGGGTLSTGSTPLRAGDIIRVEVTSTDTDTIWDYTVNYPMGMAPLNTILNDDAPAGLGRSNTVLIDDMWLA